jgi:hypothetical protein
MYCDRGSREGISRGTLALSFGLGQTTGDLPCDSTSGSPLDHRVERVVSDNGTKRFPPWRNSKRLYLSSSRQITFIRPLKQTNTAQCLNVGKPILPLKRNSKRLYLSSSRQITFIRPLKQTNTAQCLNVGKPILPLKRNLNITTILSKTIA